MLASLYSLALMHQQAITCTHTYLYYNQIHVFMNYIYNKILYRYFNYLLLQYTFPTEFPLEMLKIKFKWKETEYTRFLVHSKLFCTNHQK